MIEPEVEYLADASVTPEDDAALRSLLSTCYSEPSASVFARQRYYRDPHPHRWVIRDTAGVIVAHVGVPDRTVEHAGRTYRIGGIADVAVHPDYRRRGWMRRMLRDIHDWQRERGFVFSVLFGADVIYGSSGYVRVENLWCDADEGAGEARGNRIATSAMIKPLTDLPWPDGEIHLPGATF